MNVAWGAVAALVFIVAGFACVALAYEAHAVMCGFAAVSFAILATRE